MSRKEILYPLNKDGGLMSWYDQRGGYYAPHELVPNRVFEATLQFVGSGRGRSSVLFHFKDEAGRQYPMFVSELGSVILRKSIQKGRVHGTWTFCKKGANFSIKLAESELSARAADAGQGKERE